MKKYLALLIAFLFITIQFGDVAVLDAGAANALTVYSATDHGPESLPAGDVIAHCGCHGLHHMGLGESVAGLTYVVNTSSGILPRFSYLQALSEGPPVPPPNT